MADTDTQVAATDVVATPVDATTQTQAGADAPQGDEGWRNPAEIKAALRELRTLKAEVTALKSNGKTMPSKTEPLSDVAELRAELTLRDALADMGLSPRAKQRKIISDQYRMDRPDDVGSWLEEMSDALNLRTSKPMAPSVGHAPNVSVPQATNLGAPQREERVIPRDVRQIAPTDWAAMTPLERRDRFDDTMKAEGRGNPFYKPLPGAK